LTGRDLLDLLEAELRRLPEAYRLAVVFCCIEGLSLEEAARRLHWTTGSLRGKLERARKCLHARLVKRGVTLSAVLAVAEVERGVTHGMMPAAFGETTAQAVLRCEVPGSVPLGTVSANTLLLADGALRAMWPLSLPWVVLLVVALGGMGTVGGVMLGQVAPVPDTEKGTAVAAPPRGNGPAESPRAKQYHLAPGPKRNPSQPDGAKAVTPPEERKDPWRKRLANGVTVELAGVALHPSEPGKWWRPDGPPLHGAPYDKLGGQIVPSAGKKAREFAFRLRDVPAASYGWRCQFRPAGNMVAGGVEKGGRPLPEVFGVLVLLPNEDRTCTARFGVAAGPWKTLASGLGGETIDMEKLSIIFGTPRQVKDHTAISVTHNEFQRDVRLVLIDKDGKEHTPTFTQGQLGEGIAQIDAKFGVPVDRVREFRFQVRPFEWAEFPNVRLDRDPQVVSLIVLDLFLVDGEPRLQVIGQGHRMVLGAGVQPQAAGVVTPGRVDGPLEEILPQALADELRHQAELRQFDLPLLPPVQLGKAGRDAIDRQDVNFVPGVGKDGREFGVGHLFPAGPVVIPPHGVVQEPIVGESRPPGVDDR